MSKVRPWRRCDSSIRKRKTPGGVLRLMTDWSGQRDLNPRPSAPEADALPNCAMSRRFGE